MRAERRGTSLRAWAVAVLASCAPLWAEVSAERGAQAHEAPPREGERRDAPLREEPTSPASLLPDPYGDGEAVRAAIDRALAFLSARQAEEQDGAFPPTGARQHAPVAVTALGALAYMAAGSQLGRGPHGRELGRAVDYLLAQCDRVAGSSRLGYIAAGGDEVSRTHGHGFATLALAEAFSVAPRTPRGRRIEEVLKLAVACIEDSQGLEGGWYYEPVPGLQHEGSVTIALVQALRACKNAGIPVDPDVIAKAVDYVERSQKEDGSFRYALGSDDSSVALTAAALSTLHASGRYHGREILAGYGSIERELAARALDTGQDVLSLGAVPFPYYERLYLAQAYWQNPDRTVFEAWARAERRELLKQQREDGGWGNSPYGDCYATAVNVLVLSLPDELLPIFQR